MLYFPAVDEGFGFRIIADGSSIGFVKMSMEAYEDLSKAFGKTLPKRNDQEPFVNRRWALDFLRMS